MAPRVITFSDDEIPADGTTHTHPLSILVSCRAQIVPAVLIDNGSGLNVCTLSSVKALGLGHGDMKRKTMTVGAFENSVRQTVGVIELDVGSVPQDSATGTRPEESTAAISTHLYEF
jgi:hypothetical protein